jgi:hypothetical protein
MPSKTDEFGIPTHGSALHIAYYVECEPDTLAHALDRALGIKAPHDWVSPRLDEGFREYWDRRFIEKVGHAELAEPLAQWWPRGGAHWDALARVGQGSVDGVLLVEAKANIPEIANGSPCAAGAPSSSQASKDNRERITQALRETMCANGVDVAHASAWIGSHCYQYANRLAHLHFLRQQGVEAWLAHIYFLDDPSFVAAGRDEFDRQRALDAARMGLESVRLDRVAPVYLNAKPDAHDLLRQRTKAYLTAGSQR